MKYLAYSAKTNKWTPRFRNSVWGGNFPERVMQSKAFDAADQGNESTSPLKRRGLILGAGVAGAAAIAATALPLAPAPVAPAVAGSAAAAEKGGYQVTQHVLRYYQTTRI